MVKRVRSIVLRLKSIFHRTGQELKLSPNYQFLRDICGIIWGFKWYSLAILGVTVLQEFAALWPVSALGQFIDSLGSGEMGNVVWLFLGASITYPAIFRCNVILRHKMFFESDFAERVELTLSEADRGECADVEEATAAHTRVVNAVSGLTNAAYHILGDIAPVVVKIVVVAGKLLAYNKSMGLVYLGTLVIPAVMTILFNSKLRVHLDAQYSVISKSVALGVRTINDRENSQVRERFTQVMVERKNIFFSLLSKSQSYIYTREIALVGSQFLVIFLALSMRQELNLTPGDFTRIIGYTAQVSAAFIGAASVLDAIISYSRAYHVYVKGHHVR